MSTVAVLGGGISGLSTAYYLARLAPSTTRILLIEGKERLGGWIQSKRQEDVLFETGPRTLRPDGVNGAILLEMIRHLNLHGEDHLLGVPKSDPSAKNRYIYYNGEINTLPSSLSGMLLTKPPVFKSVLLAGALEPLRKSRFLPDGSPKDGIEDESMYDFIKRRFNHHTAINLMGALAHGVYAGDVKQLSIQSTFSMLYEAEKLYGSVVKGMMRGASNTATMRERGMAVRAKDQDPSWFGKMEKMSLLGFKQGMETLPRQLKAYLETCANVEIIQGDPVESIALLEQESKIKTKHSEYHVDHVVSALPAHTLNKLIPQKLPHLTHNSPADVAIVNLLYDPEVKLAYDGFGFLTPHRDTEYPLPLPGTLGVIFDSNVFKEPKGGVKVTVMMGGADWKQAFQSPIEETDPSVAYDYAQKSMDTYLGIKANPVSSLVSLQRQCIPQYWVGHQGRMRQLHHALKDHYGHHMSVTGASYLGVSVPDCIKNSRMLVEELLVAGALGSREKIVTGLGKIDVSSQELKEGNSISKGNTRVILQS